METNTTPSAPPAAEMKAPKPDRRPPTVGMRTILQAKRILLLAGADKADIVRQAMTGPVTPQVPASLLQLHPNVTVVQADA